MPLIQGRARRRDPRVDLITMIVPALVGAITCAIALGSRSLWLDEGSTVAVASQSGSALWDGIKHDGGNMLAYYLGMHVLIAWFGDAAWVLRLPSVLANAATGAMVAAIAIRLFASRRIATTAGLLTVISLPLVYWGQNARGYALMVAFTVASFLALIVILQTPRQYEPSRRALFTYVATLLIAFYIGFDVAIVIPAQLALLFIFRERARVVIGCLLTVALLCIPLAVMAAERGSGQLFWVAPLSLTVVRQALDTLLSSGMPPNFHHTFTTVATEIVMALATLVAVVSVARAAFLDTRPNHTWQLILILNWLVLTAASAVVLLAIGEPIELSRVTILAMPALALALAWTFTHPALSPALGTFVIALLIVLRFAQVIPAYGTSPENWKAATAYVVSATTSAKPACVAFYPLDGRESFDYYVRVDHRGGGDPAADLTPVLPRLGWVRVRPFVEQYSSLDSAELSSITSRCARLWLIASHEGQSDGTRGSRANLERFRGLERALKGSYRLVTARAFGWASAVKVILYRRG
jgi:hypothetical protein